MLSLVFSHDMLGFIDGSLKKPPEYNNGSNTKYLEWKRSDVLVQGWIFGSLSEDVMGAVVDLHTAHEVWNKLETKYTTPPAPVSTSTSATNEFDKYIPLCRAIEMGDWEKAEEVFNQDRKALTDKLDEQGNTTLHVAIKNLDNIWFLENLLKKIDTKSLPTMVNNNNLNALQYAVMFGKHLIVTKLVEKNPHLLFMASNVYNLPFITAANDSQKTTFLYLLQACKEHIELVKDGNRNPFKGELGSMLLRSTIRAGFLDAAYDLLKDYPDLLARTEDNDFRDTLTYLAERKDAYPSTKGYNSYQRFVYSHVPAKNCSLGDKRKIPDIENQETYRTNFVTWKSYVNPVMERIYIKFWEVAVQHVSHIKHLHENKVKLNTTLSILKFILEKSGKQYENALIVAVENNILEAVEQIIRVFPQSIRTCKDYKYTLYELSIMNRSENVYNFLVHELTHDKDLHSPYSKDDGNNLLHLAGRLAPQEKLNTVVGVVLQMQRELQWFKEVSTLVRPIEREAKNSNKETPIMVFRKQHENLRQKAEDWMRKTVDSYTITHALIITIVFAAAITVPGGNNGDTGKPIYNTKSSFIIFIISDAISLFTSTTSLMLFLSMLTARYAHDDFLYTLPKTLIVALVLLFMSMTTMLLAFSATLYLLYEQQNAWILMPISAIACLPMASFMTLQLPLLVDLLTSTFSHEIFGKRSDLRITT